MFSSFIFLSIVSNACVSGFMFRYENVSSGEIPPESSKGPAAF